MINVLAAILAITGLVLLFQESRRTQCEANLSRLGLAFTNTTRLTVTSPRPHSCEATARRVKLAGPLLPHLGYQPLYERFHLDEPWDSPHNRALLAEMPPELACPAQGRPARWPNRVQGGHRAEDRPESCQHPV